MKNEFLIKSLLNDVNTEIQKLRNKYNNNIIEFKIGDIVYYFSDQKIIKGKIVDIDDYTNGGKCPTALVYYWITPKSAFVRLYERLKYRYCILFDKTYIPGKLFFTNSVLFGNDIFKTEEDAENAKILYNLRFYMYEYMIEILNIRD